MNRDFLQIDELRLDKECLRQPGLYMEYAEKLADAKRDLDECRAAESLIAAELSKDARERPAKFDIGDKVTEGAINAAVQAHPKLRAAQAETLKAKHAVDVLSSAVVALEHKKRSLTLLVNLHGQGFFADVRGTKAGKDAVNDKTKETVRRLGQRKDSRAEDEDDED